MEGNLSAHQAEQEPRRMICALTRGYLAKLMEGGLASMHTVRFRKSVNTIRSSRDPVDSRNIFGGIMFKDGCFRQGRRPS